MAIASPWLSVVALNTPVHTVAVVQHPSDVLIRARCLAASALVAFAGGDGELLDLAAGLADGIWGELTPLERRALEEDALDPAELARLSWQTVSAGVLLWALGRAGAPPIGEQAPEARAVIDNVIEHPSLTAEDGLRPLAELRGFGREVRAWAWATRNEQLVRSTGSTSVQQPVPENANAVPVYADAAAPAGMDDLVVDGGHMRDVGEQRLDELLSINSERLRAVRWLLGETDWDSVPLSV